MRLSLLIGVTLSLLHFNLKAQLSSVWANSIGSTVMEYGEAIAVDPSGNVYITGSYSTTIDFDPGPGVVNMGNTLNEDIFIAKYSPTGALIWVEQITGPGNQRAYDLVADATGIYLAGTFNGTTDFDPAWSSSYNVVCLGGGIDGDGFFAKYDLNGNLVWANRVPSIGNDKVTGIAVDASQNVYVTGLIGFNTDMDPSAATFSLMVSLGTSNAFIGKYNSTGGLIYAKQITGSYSAGEDINVDLSGNIYLTGSFSQTNDFDPSASTANLITSSSAQVDVFLAKYDPAGNYTFAKQIGGTGTDIGYQVVPDATGNIYLGGGFSNVCDFDPSASTSNVVSAGQSDLFVAKYTSIGNLIWVNRAGGTTNDYCYGLGLDASDNVFITGKFQGTNVDFDPGPLAITLTASSSCLYVAAYYPNGGFWFANSPGNIASEGRGMLVDSNVYLTGFFYDTGDFDFSASTSTLASNGSGDVFFAKYNTCTGSPPSQPSSISTNTQLCTGASDTFSVINDPTATGYIWAFPNGWSGTSSTNSINLTTFTSGIVYVAATNSCGISAISSLSINIGGFTGSTILPTQISCFGSNNGSATLNLSGGIYPLSYTWTPSSQTTSVLSNAFAGTYTAFVSDAYGCTTQNTITITEPPQLTLTTNTLLNVTCNGWNNGGAGAIAAGGTPAYAYSWQSSTSFTPGPYSLVIGLTAGNYTLTVTDIKNCTASIAYTITQPPALTVVSSITTAACNNSNGSATVIINGGVLPYVYSWTPVTQTTNIISGVASGNYVITCKDLNNCIKTHTVTITMVTIPTISISMNPGIFCSGDTATLTASGANTYTWDTSSNSTSIIVSPTTNITYSITGDVSGCNSSTAYSINILSNPTVFINPNSTLTCSGNNVTLTAMGANTYTWDNNSNANPIVITPTTGTNTYSAIGTGTNGCTNSAITTISVLPNPTILLSSSDSLICAGESVTLTASGANTFTWSNNSNSSSIIITPSTSITYSIDGTDSNGCTNSATITQSVSTCTELQSFVSEGIFEVYPNPFKDELRLKLKKEGVIQIYNIIGQVLYSVKATVGEQKINTENFQKGIYFIRVENSRSIKLIKQ